MPDPSDRGRPSPRLSSPGIFEALLAAAPQGPVGWVIQGFADERIETTLSAGRPVHLDDARVQGKIAGQPVLFLQTGRPRPRWVAWGTVVGGDERWRQFGLDILCRGLLRPGLPVVEASGDAPTSATAPAGARAHVWEHPELGRALGLEASRPRTPYLETGARDLRLSVHDLALLVALQPRLRQLGAEPSWPERRP
jgi:hypothetical protein